MNDSVVLMLIGCMSIEQLIIIAREEKGVFLAVNIYIADQIIWLARLVKKLRVKFQTDVNTKFKGLEGTRDKGRARMGKGQKFSEQSRD